MEENYKVDLGNGTIFENLILNGTDFMTKDEISEDTFDGMEEVRIIDGKGNTEVLNHPVLVHCGLFPDEYYHFALRNLLPEEIKADNDNAQLFYTAVMTDTLMEV